MGRWSLVLSALLTAGASAGSAAQELTAIRAGRLVDVETPDERSQEGQ